MIEIPVIFPKFAVFINFQLASIIDLNAVY